MRYMRFYGNGPLIVGQHGPCKSSYIYGILWYRSTMCISLYPYNHKAEHKKNVGQGGSQAHTLHPPFEELGALI